MTLCPHCSESVPENWINPLCPSCGEDLSGKKKRRFSFSFGKKRSASQAPHIENPLEPKVVGKKKKESKKKVILIPAEHAIVAPVDRIPTFLMLVLTLFTLGLFPVYWFAQRFPRFNRLARREKQIGGWLVAVDLGLTLIWWCTLIVGIIRIAVANDIALALDVITIKIPEIIFSPPFLAFPIAFIIHRHLILWARWNLRSFVARRNRELAKIVAPSWLLLWVFGGFYLQYHINKLHDVHFFIQKEKIQRAVIKIEHS